MQLNFIKLFFFLLVFISLNISADDKDNYENTLWDSVLNSDTRAMYEAYIKEYPNGHYISLAKIRYRQLGGNIKSKNKTVNNRNINKKLTASDLLKKCSEHFNSKRLTSGRSGNAYDCYQKVLQKEPNNLEAQEGINNIALKYLSWAKVNINKNNLKKAEKYFLKAEEISPNLKDIPVYRQLIEEKKNNKS